MIIYCFGNCKIKAVIIIRCGAAGVPLPEDLAVLGRVLDRRRLHHARPVRHGGRRGRARRRHAHDRYRSARTFAFTPIYNTSTVCKISFNVYGYQNLFNKLNGS